MQVGDGVLEGVLAARPVALEGVRVLAVDERLGPHRREDRLAGEPDLERGELAVRVQAALELRLHDRVIAAVRHVLFARPDELHRRARHLLGNRDHLLHVVVRRAPAKAAARRHLVNIALRERQA